MNNYTNGSGLFLYLLFPSLISSIFVLSNLRPICRRVFQVNFCLSRPIRDRWTHLSLLSVHDWCLSFLSICLSWDIQIPHEWGSASFIFSHFIPAPCGCQIFVCFSLAWHTLINIMAWVAWDMWKQISHNWTQKETCGTCYNCWFSSLNYVDQILKSRSETKKSHDAFASVSVTLCGFQCNHTRNFIWLCSHQPLSPK